jgi:hypothetical protein
MTLLLNELEEGNGRGDGTEVPLPQVFVGVKVKDLIPTGWVLLTEKKASENFNFLIFVRMNDRGNGVIGKYRTFKIRMVWDLKTSILNI